MKLTHKTAGLGIAAVAVLLLGTAAIADNMGQMRMGDGMGGHGMMAGPVLDLAAIDADKDGKISKDELTAFRAARVASVDGNADGKLSAAEMADRPLPAEMFDRVDSNGDGFIDQSEIDAAKSQMMERGGRMSGHGRHSMGDHDGMGDGGN